jgi:hypothetical protein
MIFILVEGGGQSSTKADFAEAKSRRVTYQHQDASAQAVRVWGDTAMVTAKLWGQGTNAHVTETTMKKNLTLLLLCLILFSSGLPARAAKDYDHPMNRDEQRDQRRVQQYGNPNPKAPAELARWAFLIGARSGEAKLKLDDGTWQTLRVTWEGHYILDGHAIEDEYRMTTAAGELLVLGMNFRAYDAQKKSWNMKWLNGVTGTWTDLGDPNLGGVHIDEKSIWYILDEAMANHALTRATYSNISPDHFTWRGERSNDGKTWEEFLVVDVGRTRN